MNSVGYYNGEWGALDQMRIPMLDRVSFYGDGVYDATISSQGVILYEDEHLDRFFNSCKLMAIKPSFSREELREKLRFMVDQVDATDTFVYWQVTRGTDFRHHDFPDCPSNLWITVEPLPLVDLSVEGDVITTEDTRFYHCNAKTLNLLPNVLASQKAKEAGCCECIFVRDGYVTECAHSNVHIIKDGALITHPTDNLILPGIARAHLIAMCKKFGVPVKERPFTEAELFDADEVLVSASSTFAKRIAHVDGKPVAQSNPELVRLLQGKLTEEFEAYIRDHR